MDNSNQEETSKFNITAACIAYSIFDDYCTVISELTSTDREIIKSRILEKADDNLKKLKGLIEQHATVQVKSF